MIKLIFSDMDGTLITPDGNLPEGFDKMFDELKKRNVTFVPSSGRQYYSLLKTFEKYKDDMIFLADNGTLVRHGKGDVYYTDVMEKEVCLRLVKKCEEIDAPYVILCGVKSIYIKHDWDKHMDVCAKYFDRYTFVDSFDDIDDEIMEIAVADFDHRDVERRIYKPMLEAFGDSLEVVLGDEIWINIFNAGAGKGRAVKELQKLLGISDKEMAAFGNYPNDCSMLEAVYYSYAMDNAHDDLKKVAKFSAPSNREFGVVRQIYKMIEDGLI